MQLLLPARTRLAIGAVLTALLCQGAFGQDERSKDTPEKAAPVREATGIPPRATPAEYQAHAQAGAVTVAAEFTRHSVATLQATLLTEDYVVVEVGLFGPPEARLKISHEDFALRINGKKTSVQAEPYGVIFHSLKDPEWVPPEPPGGKSKTGGITTDGGQGADNSAPAPVHMPIELERVMHQRVQKAALPEGDRVLPQAGLIFFQYHGKSEGIRTVELTYTGPTGKALLDLHP
jgi:hypothetical protein